MSAKENRKVTSETKDRPPPFLIEMVSQTRPSGLKVSSSTKAVTSSE